MLTDNTCITTRSVFYDLKTKIKYKLQGFGSCFYLIVVLVFQIINEQINKYRV